LVVDTAVKERTKDLKYVSQQVRQEQEEGQGGRIMISFC
jgi:hypothetical protein